MALLRAHGSQDGPRYRFLVELAFGGHSPSMDVLALGAALATRGHEVAVVVPQGEMAFSTRAAGRHGGGAGAAALRWLPYDMPFTTASAELRKNAGSMLRQRNALSMLRGLASMVQRPCQIMMGNATLIEGLQRGAYDAVLSFQLPFGSDSCGCVLAHKLRAPLITLHAVPFLLAPRGVPQFGSGLSWDDLATWRGAAKNTALWAASHAMLSLLGRGVARGFAPLRAAHGIPRGAAAVGGSCAPMLQLCANSWHLEAPRPLAPPQVLIGPICPRAGRGAVEPPAAAEWLGGAPAGAAVVSFGSVPFLAGSLLGREDFTALARGFADLAPLRVLWLLKRTNLPDNVTLDDLPLGPNTLVQEWVDTNDALAHPAARLFVTHGGCHSAYEAVFHGLPVVCVPFQFEQTANCRRLEALGLGRVSPEAPGMRRKGATYTREGVASLMRHVLEEPSYAAAARRVSAAARMQAATRPPLDAAVAEVEMAMVHRDYGRYRVYGASAPAAPPRAAERSEL